MVMEEVSFWDVLGMQLSLVKVVEKVGGIVVIMVFIVLGDGSFGWYGIGGQRIIVFV